MHREIYKLAIIRAMRSFMIVMPIIAIYFQEHGLSLRDIFVLQVIFSIMIVVLEVPSGYFADVFGRKGSLVLGVATGALGFFLYYVAGGFAGFVIAELVLALSIAFLSGADSAFLYDTLQQHGAVDRHVRFEGRIISSTRIAEASAALLSGFLVTIMSFKSIFLIQFLVMLLALPVALSLREPVIPPSTEKRRSIIGIVKFALHENKRLLHLNIFSGIISATTLSMVWFAQPYWKELNVDIAYFGVMWAGLNIIVGVAAYYAHLLERRLRFRTLFAGVACAPLVLYGLLSVGLGWYALIVIPFFWVLRGLYLPISKDYINRETDSASRATVLSVSALFGRLTFSVLSPFLGWIGDLWSIETAFLAAAFIFGTLSLTAFFLLYREMARRDVSI